MANYSKNNPNYLNQSKRFKTVSQVSDSVLIPLPNTNLVYANSGIKQGGAAALASIDLLTIPDTGEYPLMCSMNFGMAWDGVTNGGAGFVVSVNGIEIIKEATHDQFVRACYNATTFVLPPSVKLNIASFNQYGDGFAQRYCTLIGECLK